MNNTHSIPMGIELHKRRKVLELIYSNDQRYELSCEYLRVQSPSAEVKGHGPDQAILQEGKIDVGIDHIEPVGNYALQLVFSDGHNTGIFSWAYLYELCTNQEQNWQDYLDRLAAEGKTRDPNVQVVRIGN
ncbi:MAG: DUF971 family protein [Oceanicoccus sp.]|jgi:DUF971 family protein